MTACEREREAIGALVDGELEGAERAALEAHLAGCSGCRQELDELRRLAAAFATLAPVEPAADFEARFWARIAREGGAAPGFAERLRRLFSPGGFLAAGIAAAAALFLYLNVPHTRAPAPTGAPASLARVEPAAVDTDVRILTNAHDVEILQDPDVDAISEVDLLEDWDDAEPG